MSAHPVVSSPEWTKARKAFLAKEKEFTRARDALSKARRDLPWERVEKKYVFDSDRGEVTLSDLFDQRSQLVVYHFMLGPDDAVGCKGCSFWADNFERNVVHLAHRDVTLVTVSRAPLTKIDALKKRLGWTFPWVSSGKTDFNFDYGVSFEASRGPAPYNYAERAAKDGEMPGISVFARDESGAVFHTYSTYGRGLDMLNAGYHYLDLVPKGRDEDNLPQVTSWLRQRDKYESDR